MNLISSTKLYLQQNGYFEPFDESSLPLISHMLNDIQKLKFQVYDYKSKALNPDTEYETMKNRIKELEEVNQQLTAKFTAIQVEYNAYRTALPHKQTEEDLSSSPPVPMSDHLDMIHTLTQEKENVEKEKERLQRQYSELQNTYKESEKCLNSLQRDYGVLQTKLQQSLSEKTLVEETQVRYLSIRIHQQTRREFANIQQLYHSLQQQLHQAQADAQTAHSKELVLTAKLTELQSQCQLLEESKRKCQEDVLHSSSELHNVSSLYSLEKQSSEMLTRSLERERRRSDQLQQQVSSFQRTIDELQSTLRTANGRIESLQQQIGTSEQQEQKTYRELNELRKKYDELFANHLSDKHFREQSLVETTNQREELTRLRQTHNLIEKQLHLLQSEKSQLLRENHTLRLHIEEKDQQIRMVQEMLETEQTNSLLKLTELQSRLRRRGGKRKQQEKEQEMKGEGGNITPHSSPNEKSSSSSSSTTTTKRNIPNQDDEKHPISSFQYTPEKENQSDNIVLPIPTSPFISPLNTPNNNNTNNTNTNTNIEEEEREKERKPDED